MPCVVCLDRGFLRVRRLDAPVFRYAVRLCECNGGAPVDPAKLVRRAKAAEQVVGQAGADLLPGHARIETETGARRTSNRPGETG